MPMKYYKLTDGHTIVGIIDSDCFRKYKPATKICVYAGINDAQLAEYQNKYYRDDWLRPLTDFPKEIIEIGIVKITEDEYNNLKSQFDEGDFVEDESLDEIVNIEPIEEEEQEAVKKTTAQILARQIELAARFAEV